MLPWQRAVEQHNTTFANNLCWCFSAVVMKKCEEYCIRHFLVLPACSRVYYRTEMRQELIKEGHKKELRKKEKENKRRNKILIDILFCCQQSSLPALNSGEWPQRCGYVHFCPIAANHILCQ